MSSSAPGLGQVDGHAMEDQQMAIEVPGVSDAGADVGTSINFDADADAEGGEGAGAAGGEEEEEEEYEIESILGHEEGRFIEGEMAYLVSWKDYGEEHNSWVRAADAEGAQDMINEYWSRTPKKDVKRSGPAPRGRKKGKQGRRQSSLLQITSSPATTSKKRARDGTAIGTSRTRGAPGATGSAAALGSARKAASRGVEMLPSRSPSPYEADEGVDERLEEIANDDTLSAADKIKLQKEHLQQQKVEHIKRKYGRIADWDPIIRQITGIENIGGKLWAYMHFTSGDHVSFPLQVAEERCPRQLNKFFIAHIRFKTSEGLKEYVAPMTEPSPENGNRTNGDGTAPDPKSTATDAATAPAEAAEAAPEAVPASGTETAAETAAEGATEDATEVAPATKVAAESEAATAAATEAPSANIAEVPSSHVEEDVMMQEGGGPESTIVAVSTADEAPAAGFAATAVAAAEVAEAAAAQTTEAAVASSEPAATCL
ncbi:hypothetical protein ACQY0O_003514 [Thecaphora frezii]